MNNDHISVVTTDKYQLLSGLITQGYTVRETEPGEIEVIGKNGAGFESPALVRVREPRPGSHEVGIRNVGMSGIVYPTELYRDVLLSV